LSQKLRSRTEAKKKLTLFVLHLPASSLFLKHTSLNILTCGQQIKWRNALTWNLARHAISEELTVYPAMEKFLGAEGKALAKEDFEQHQAVRPLIYPSKPPKKGEGRGEESKILI
jgi:hypothetical protein